jgi:hypothetical protein
VVWQPWPTSASTPARISSSRKPKTRRAIREGFCRLYEAENRERERALRQAEIYRGNSLPEGEIIAIITVIELGFIGIIIIITSTIITTPSRYNILG